VLWDFGGVILDSPFDGFARYEEEHRLAPGFLRGVIATDSDTNAWARLERGEVDLAEFAALFEQEARAAGEAIDGGAVLGALTGRPRPAMVEAVRRCAERLPTGLVTNNFTLGGAAGPRPDLEAILVVPNNAHALFGRPMVTSPDAMIAIETEASGNDALLFCDGRREMLVPAGGRLEVTRCGTPVKWARLDSASFTDRLVRKFRLPVTGWRGK